MSQEQPQQPSMQPGGYPSYPPRIPPLFPGMSLDSDAIKAEIGKAVQEQVKPITEQLKAMSPVINQYAQQNQAVKQETQKRGIMQDMGLWMQILSIANGVLDQPRVEKIYHTFVGELAEAAVSSGGLVNGAKNIAFRELMAFARTKEGQEWMQMGVDAYFGSREIAFK